MLDLTTGKETQITNFQDTKEEEPYIYGNRIVYTRYIESTTGWPNSENWHEDVYVYDLETKENKLISDSQASKSNLKIFENKIIWEEKSIKGIGSSTFIMLKII